MSDSNPGKNIPENLKLRIFNENLAMIKFLAGEGKSIPKLASKILTVSESKNQEECLSNNEMLHLHKQLSHKILPAKPNTILLLHKESKNKSRFRFLGPVPLVRQFMSVTLLCLLLFISLGVSKNVNREILSAGLLNSHGLVLLENLIFLLAAAALGGCFSELFQINKYISLGIYDPKFESSYWIRLLLGIVAGLMLAVIIPVSKYVNPEEASLNYVSVPLLAMLGGFSASLVYRILTRLVWAVESVFIGKQEDKATQKIISIQNLHEQEKLHEQKHLHKKLLKIKSQLSTEKSKIEIEKSIDELLQELLE
jgi:hypothetical protein